MVRPLRALVVASVIALAGCGGSSSSDKAAKRSARSPAAVKAVRESPRAAAALTAGGSRRKAAVRHAGAAPEPGESLANALAAFKAAAASGDCQKLLPLRHSAERGGAPPGSAPTQEECTKSASVIADLKDEVPVANERFGTAAVVDYTRDGQDLTGLWLVEADGRWRFLLNGEFLVHSVGSRPARSDLFDEGVNGFLAAAQAKNCDEMYRFLNPDSPLLFGGTTKDQWCSFVTPLYTAKNNFFAAAPADPSAKAQLMGANRLYGLYSVDFNNGTYWVLVGKVTPSNVAPEQAQGHVDNGFQLLYSGSFAPS